jgi:hypothetical protein
MGSSALTPLSVYLCASVYPRLLNDPAMLAKLDPDVVSTLTPHGPCTDWRRGSTYWTKVGAARRLHAQQSGYSLQHLRDAVAWSSQSAQHLTTAHIKVIRDTYAHAEWEVEHSAPPALLLSPSTPPPKSQRSASLLVAQPHQPQHPTSAPLTKCKPGPGLPPFLSRWSRTSHRQRILRARFLMGRACTGAVRLRFATTSDRPSIDDRCAEPSCQPAPLPAPAPMSTIDTIEHALLHCARHQQQRQVLCTTLQQLHLPLTLSSILVAHPPPPPFAASQLSSLLHATSLFLSTIEAERLAAGLTPLDTG